mgnify:FL=1
MPLTENIKSYVQANRISKDKENLFKLFLKKGFPTTKNEEWKYTSLKNVINSSYTLHHDDFSVDDYDINKHAIGFIHKIIFFNGTMVYCPKIDGVNISLNSNFKGLSNDAFNLLNESVINCGFTLTVNKNTTIKNPVEVLFFTSTRNSFTQYRNQINIKKNSNIKIVEKIQNLSDSTCLVNHNTQVNCDENSIIEYNKIQDNTYDSRLIDYTNVFQKKDSVCNINTLIFGGDFIRNNLNFEQNGNNCESNMNGITVLDRKQFADNHTFVDHKTASCRSNELYKGIYLDNSKGVFNGKIMVRKDSQKIDAFQANNNLLLSENATIDSKPQLEIYADDVKCSHGCTIGQLDEDAIFYLRSRGVGAKEARAILTYTFTSEVINKLTIPEVKKLAQRLLAKKLNVNLDLEL